jgi:hypothetical protein
VCDEDRQANYQALIGGSRILSAYRTSHGEKIWIITETADDSGNRAATTILLPSEYCGSDSVEWIPRPSFRPLENESAWFLWA